jgi:hypothetical protein
MSTPTTVMRIRLLMRHGSVTATIGPILFKSNQFLGMETDQPFLSALVVEYILREEGKASCRMEHQLKSHNLCDSLIYYKPV